MAMDGVANLVDQPEGVTGFEITFLDRMQIFDQ
jgi:hypothetical protein